MGDTSTSRPSLRLFWSIVARNHDRARRRYLRARRMEPEGEFDVFDEEPILEPPDAGTVPAEPAGSTLELPGHLHPALGDPDPRFTVKEPPNSMHAPASKRPGEPLDNSSNKGKRTSMDPEGTDLEVDLADFGIPAGNGNQIRLDAKAAGRGNAIIAPTLGRPSYERVSNMARAEHLAGESFNAISMRDSDPKLV